MRHVLYLIIVCGLKIIEMRRNIALHKTTIQSSTLSSNKAMWGSHKANNGDLRQSISRDYQCTHTSHDRTDWWAVDLGKDYHIQSVTIYNRINCICADRLSDYYIYIYRPDVTTWGYFDTRNGVLCYFHNGISPAILNVACNGGIVGRFVQIYKPYKHIEGRENALTLCEVEIYSDTTLPVKTVDISNRKGLFCKEDKKRPLLFFDIQMQCTDAKMCAFQCSALCLANDSCLGYKITVGGICSPVRASETVATRDQELKYFERC